MTQEEQEIRELVEQAKQMDMNAYGQLYDVYYERIYKYTYFKVGNRADAEDITAEVFTGALRTIKNFTWRGSSFTSWLFRIAHNCIADYWRSKKRVVIETIEDHSQIPDTTDVVAGVSARTELDSVMKEIQLLPEEQSKVVVLRLICDLSIKDTARTIGKSENAVKTLQFRAISRLKERRVKRKCTILKNS